LRSERWRLPIRPAVGKAIADAATVLNADQRRKIARADRPARHAHGTKRAGIAA
jgi:hypothetical protein